jgi:hypothetical protein
LDAGDSSPRVARGGGPAHAYKLNFRPYLFGNGDYRLSADISRLCLSRIERREIAGRARNGIPRKVNKAAHASLMAAASQNKTLVDDYLVKEVIVSELEVTPGAQFWRSV